MADVDVYQVEEEEELEAIVWEIIKIARKKLHSRKVRAKEKQKWAKILIHAIRLLLLMQKEGMTVKELDLAELLSRIPKKYLAHALLSE